ncbi:MAG: transposase [Deltaproteobacteria bacterium]|nr:transposase [Deltaproteobacteria bacterium]
MDNKQTKEEVQQNLINNLFWKSCIRNDKAVAQTLWEAREIDSIFGLEETGLLDDFFHFLQVFNIWPNIEKLNSSEIKRVMVSITHFVVLYMLKVIYGIKHMDSLRELLFSDQAAMRFVGFNAHQVKYGVCNRGDHKRKNKEKTGPITPETLSDNFVKISIRQMENFFTGRAIRKEEIVDKMGQKKTIEITVYGFKLMALFAVGAKIPIAVKVIQIQRHESQFVKALIETAANNLGRYSKINEFMADMAYLDGKTLWWLHKEKKICFVVPAKDKMDIKEDAREIARLGGDEVCFKKRVKTVIRGTGKKAYSEQIITEVYGVSELNTYAAYGLPGHDKDKHKKSFKANLINAIVVTNWRNHNYGFEKSKVFITNMDVTKNPFRAFDAYDERSIIENSLFRQSKQILNLKYPIKKTQDGIRLHLIFTMSVFALLNAYKQWAEKQYSMIEAGKECGLKRFWKKLKAENRDKVIIFIDNVYGIMNVAESMLLLGVKVKEFEKYEASKKEIFEKYEISEA